MSSPKIILAALFCILFAARLHATTFTVTTLTDASTTLGVGSGTSGDLRYCIVQANYGAAGSTHTINFSVAGTITLSGHELVINSNVTINGPGESSLTVSGNNASRVIYITPGHTVTLSGMTLTKGNGYGNDLLGLDTGGNYIDQYGGAVLNDQSVLTMNNCTLTANKAKQFANLSGGGVCNRARGGSATLTLDHCTVTGNIGGSYDDGGGGIYNYVFGATGTLSVSNSVISNNTTGGDGGGIYNYGLGTGPANATISNCTISGNSAAGYHGGGGISSTGDSSGGTSSMTVSSCIITGNSASSTGGGTTSGGGGLLHGGGSNSTNVMTLTNCTISGNTSSRQGGGISNFGWLSTTTLTVSKCTINNNTAATNGGGILNWASQGTGTLRLNNSTVALNSATQRGGGIYNADEYNFSSTASATLTNSTICGNSALAVGGGIANDKPSGGASTATVTLANTLLALNPTGANYGATNGVGISSGFNLSDDATCAAFMTQPGDLNSTAAGLQVDGTGKPLLQSSTGPTQTVALLVGSAAVDAGKSATDPVTGLAATQDQRGQQRPFDILTITNASGGDGSDIGAFEVFNGTITVAASPPAGGTVTGGAQYSNGAQATVTATPNSGYLFVNWTEAGTPVSTSAVYAFTVSGPRNLTATFRTIVPQTIVVEAPAGTPLTSGTGTLNMGTVILGTNATTTFTVRNSGDLALTLGTPSFTGTNSGDFSLSVAPSATVAASGSTTFSVVFAPASAGAKTAVMQLTSNDATHSPFIVNIAGNALTFSQDSDGDGLNDASEFQMAALGFDWQVKQTSLVNTLLTNASGAGLYTPSQVQALNVGTTLLQQTPGTKTFKLTLGIRKSTDLIHYTAFPMTSPSTVINAQGEVEFSFTAPDNAAFFRLEAR
ncbi:beta strand repeat-containing protein [Prosthecobacter sp.]|uniref:beta strand repeat-containing protein n=1 Tax=Prosthecobacter sp. TaxID=1965333 RepID=UPI003783863C